MASSTKSRTTVITVLAAALVLAGILAYLFRSSQGTVEVRSAKVSYQDLISTVATNGKVEPIDEFPAYAAVPGTVEKIYVDVLQKVKVGTLLIKMSDSEAYARLASSTSALAQQKAAQQDLLRGGTQDELNGFKNDLNRAEMQRQQAAKSLADLQALQQKGAASAGEVTAAQQRVDNAKAMIDSIHQRMGNRFSAADVARSNAQVADAEAGVAAASHAVADSEIRSKIAGTVYSISVSDYDYVHGGDNLLNVADLNRIQVRAYFDEPEIGKLSVGQPVKIIWDAKPNQTWHGHIERTPSSVITYGTRNVGECLITVDDAKGDLLPNTNVTATVTTMQRFHVLSIPREALHTDGARSFIYVIKDGRLVQTPVQVGAAVNLTRVEIAGGLSENESIALNATSNRDLTNGLKVKAVE